MDVKDWPIADRLESLRKNLEWWLAEVERGRPLDAELAKWILRDFVNALR